MTDIFSMNLSVISKNQIVCVSVLNDKTQALPRHRIVDIENRYEVSLIVYVFIGLTMSVLRLEIMIEAIMGNSFVI